VKLTEDVGNDRSHMEGFRYGTERGHPVRSSVAPAAGRNKPGRVQSGTVSGGLLRSVVVTSVVAAASVATVGLLSPFPAWVALVAAAIVGLVAPAVVITHRPVGDDEG